MVKQTTYDLVNQYLELTHDAELENSLENPRQSVLDDYGTLLIDMEKLMMDKTENLHWILAKMKESEGSINGKIDAHKDTINSLKKKQKSITNAQDRVKSLIMTIVELQGTENRTGNIQLKTDTESYTIVEGWGPVDYGNIDILPDRVKTNVVKVDKSILRKIVIDHNGETPFAVCPKVRRLQIR